MADGVAHVAHLAGPPFVDGDSQQRRVAAPACLGRVAPFGTCIRRAGPFESADELHFRRSRAASFDHDAAREPIEVVRIRQAQHLCFVDTLDLVARMGERHGEIAVVGENQQTLGIVVEPPYRVDVLAYVLQQIQHRRPPLGIRSRGDVPGRLVEQKIAERLRALDAAIVDADFVGLRVGFAAELAHGLAVHRDAALDDQLLGRPPRRHAGGREDLLQPNFHHGILTTENTESTEKS